MTCFIVMLCKNISTVAYEMITASKGHGEIFQVFSAGSSSLKKIPMTPFFIYA